MENLPDYIKIIFILTTILTLFIFYKARPSRTILILLLAWLAGQGLLSTSGFYTITTGTPPHFALLLFPPLIFILGCFLFKKTRMGIDQFDQRLLTLLHIIRIPVELTLYFLFLNKIIPQVMTFEGRNFDILCGLTAPFTYYFGYLKNRLSRNFIMIWNILCLMLLANIVLTAVLSAPFSFQKLAFDQPNIALFYFPFSWLVCFIVPIVFFSHLATIRQLAKSLLYEPKHAQ